MQPHLFRSVVHPGMWACMQARPAISGPRKLEPVPNAVVIYGITPRDAYFRWKKYHAARCGANPRHAYERWLEYSKL